MKSRSTLSRPTSRRLDEHRASREAVDAVVHFIWSALRRRGVPERDRHDLLQDILLAALEAWPRYDADIATLQKWLNGIILHQIQRWQARCARHPLANTDEHERQDHEQNPEDAAMMRELATQLYQEIPPDLRDAFVAFECEGLSLEEIAASRGISRSTAHYRVREGRRHFEAALARWKEQHRDRGILLLPLTAKALLDADRTIPNAPDDVLDLAWDKMQRALGKRALDGDTDAPAHGDEPSHNGGDGPPAHPHAPATDGEPPMHLRPEDAARPTAGPVVVALIVGLIAGAWLDSLVRAPRDTIAREEAPSVSAAPPVASVAIAPAPSTSASVAPPVTPPTPGPSASAASVDTDFAADQTAFDMGRVAFVQGDMAAAIQALERHAQRFPRSKNAAERDRMWIDALVRLGRTAEACQQGERVRRAYPKSELVERLDALCSVKR